MKQLYGKLWVKCTAIVLLIMFAVLLAASALGIAYLINYGAYADGGEQVRQIAENNLLQQTSGDGWAALSTDGSNGDLYLEANNCDVVCDTIGYGTYADNGCHNVLNDCRITVDTHVAIIAGDAWVKFNGGTVKSGQYGAMLHGVRGHYTETTECHITGGDWTVGEALFFVKSENVYLKVDGAKVKTGKYLVHAIVNDDDAATKVPDDMKLKCYGVNVVIANGDYQGDIVNDDTDRTMNVSILHAKVAGVITDAYISLEGSQWTATGNSSVCLVGDVKETQIDAASGITVQAVAGEGCGLKGEYTLASGGKLIVG